MSIQAGLSILFAFQLWAAEPAGANGADAEIVRLIFENFKEPPLSAAQKTAVEKFVREADPGDKGLLPDFLRQHLDPEAKSRFLAAAPDYSGVSTAFYDRTVAALNAALGDRGYMAPLAPIREPDPLQPEADTPHVRLMALAGRLRSPKERIDAITRAIESVGPVDLRLSSALAHFERGLAYLDLRDLQNAYKDFSADLELYPSHAAGLYNRAATALMMDRWRDAQRDGDRLVALYPDLALGYLARASASSELDEKKSALSDLDKAVELAPNDVWVRLARGSELALQGRGEAALDDYNAVIERSSASAPGFAGLGDTYLDLGRYEPAARALEEALRLDPGRAGTYASLAVVHHKRGKRAEADAAFKNAVVLEPLFEVSAASVVARGRRWIPAEGGGETLEVYRFTSQTAAAIDELIRLRRPHPSKR